MSNLRRGKKWPVLQRTTKQYLVLLPEVLSHTVVGVLLPLLNGRLLFSGLAVFLGRSRVVAGGALVGLFVLFGGRGHVAWRSSRPHLGQRLESPDAFTGAVILVDLVDLEAVLAPLQHKGLHSSNQYDEKLDTNDSMND
jgi:hypothetical protein